MPIYRYKCSETDCNHAEELIQSISEGEKYLEAQTTCPKCGKQSWIRVISLGSFKLSGHGWFRDGY